MELSNVEYDTEHYYGDMTKKKLNEMVVIFHNRVENNGKKYQEIIL